MRRQPLQRRDARHHHDLQISYVRLPRDAIERDQNQVKNHQSHQQQPRILFSPVFGLVSQRHDLVESRKSKVESGESELDFPLSTFHFPLLTYDGSVAPSQRTRRSRSKSDNIMPAPSTTEESGSSAIETGRPVSCINRMSSFLSSDPPPVSTIPRSTMSAESSGGVRSSATRTALTMVATESARASRTSSSVTTMVFGMPSIRLRPLISMFFGSSSGAADPISILICSAVRSPIRRLYLRLMY